ncbi:MAG: glycosyltransferase [Bacteroidales bacterium]|jgi:hypothetical protein|nr:glycosyltransferase [Bacteroidales bacterium]
MNIPIVIPCFNRVNSLKRLLVSLEQANYGDYKPALIFSIDKSENNDVIDFITMYHWIHGEKIIYKREHNIGLKENILFCGDLTVKYDGIILIEDDLYVSPAFYLYAINAAQFYKTEKNISGISLYSYEYEELGHYRFYPFIVEYDTYFMQWPSSWGQLWLKHHWENFRIWYNEQLTDLINIPHQVKLWTHSWKKYYLSYMIETDKYFVYPFVSYTNELGGSGVHYTEHLNVNTVNLYMDSSPRIYFQPFDAAIYLYDAFFELKPQIINLNDTKIRADFDLNGNKDIGFMQSDYVISNKNNGKHIKSYGSIYVPYELNILSGEKGNSFFLYEKQMFLSSKKTRQTFEFMKTKRKIFIVKEMIKYIWIKLKIKMKIGQ